MLRAIPMLFTAALMAQAPAPSPSPALPSGIELAVQCQTDAYNAHDAQAYAACFAPDAQFIRHPGITAMSGRDEIYKTFAKFFREHKAARMRVLYRAQLGPTTVIEHQEVDGIEKVPVPSLVIYSVRGGMIQAAWFVSAE